MSDSVSRNLGIETEEDLNRQWPEPETNDLDRQVHEAVRAEHPEWPEKN